MRHLAKLCAVGLLLAGCGGGGGGPAIQSFTATPTTLPRGGGNVTLAWKVSGPGSLSIEPNIGPVSGTSIVVNVNSSRTFTLTATQGSTKATATASVTVEGSTDTTAPTLLSVSPADGATGVARDAPIVLTFSEPMNRAATQSAYQSDSAGIRPSEVALEWNAESTVLTVRPNAPLAYAAGTDPNATTALSYAFGLTANAADLAGDKLNPLTSSFKTLRRITARVQGDPALDGAVNGGVVDNGNFGMSITTTSRGFLSYSLSSLPAALQPSSLASAVLRVNAQFPIVFSTEQIELEHVLYGSTLTASAATVSALRNLGNLSQEAPVTDGWKRAEVLAAARDDLANRAARGNRSQYRLRCTGCSVIFFTAEAADSGGDARFKVPELLLEYLLP